MGEDKESNLSSAAAESDTEEDRVQKMKHKMYHNLKKKFLEYNDLDEIDINQHAFISVEKITSIVTKVLKPMSEQ